MTPHEAVKAVFGCEPRLAPEPREWTAEQKRAVARLLGLR